MKQQTTTFINDNRVNDAHITLHYGSWKKSNSTVVYIFEICCL